MNIDDLNGWIEKVLAQMESDAAAIDQAFKSIAALTANREQAPLDLAILGERLG